MKNIICVFFAFCLFVQVVQDASALDDNLLFQEDLDFFDKFIKPNIVDWELEYLEFSNTIYQQILKNQNDLSESDLLMAHEFARTSQGFLKHIIRDISQAEFKTEEWKALNEMWLEISHLQQKNLDLLEKVPLSEEEYALLKQGRMNAHVLIDKARRLFLMLHPAANNVLR